MYKSRSCAFTLIELLVVITIIVVLLSLLVPGLERAIKTTEDVKCAANLKGIGTALALYLQDSKRSYPAIAYFHLLFGNNGAKGYQNVNTDTNTRPLNKYLGVEGQTSGVGIAECPRDAGDPFSGVESDNAYRDWGNSYIVPWNWREDLKAWFRIRFVFGQSGNPATFPSMNQRAITRTQNKVIVSDWVVFGDRPIANPRVQWHDEKRRLFNTLFADSHVELFNYPIEEMEENPASPNSAKVADPNFLWW